MTDVAELRNRIAAAAAYKGYSQDALAEKIGTSRTTYNRRLKELADPRRREPFLTLIAARCGLPYAFFTVDFQRLPELDDGTGTVANGDRPDEVRALAQRVDGLRADLEVLAGEVRRRNGAAGRSSRGRARPGTPE